MMGNSVNSPKSEFDIRDKYPKCEPHLPAQLQRECWALAQSYQYSFRNCIKRTKDAKPPTVADDIYVVTRNDALNMSHCGQVDVGGWPDSVAVELDKKYGNKAIEIEEKYLEKEIKRNGPVTADIDVTAVCFLHFMEISNYYVLHRILKNAFKAPQTVFVNHTLQIQIKNHMINIQQPLLVLAKQMMAQNIGNV